MSWRNAAMKVLVVVLAVVGAEGCTPGEKQSEQTCLDNQVLRDGLCVQSCESDENCADSICLQGYCEEAVRPNLVETAPEDGGVGVAINSTIQLTFSQTMKAPQVDDILLLKGDSSIPMVVESNEDSTLFTLSPDSALSQGQIYTISVSGDYASSEGIPMGETVTRSFTTVEALNVSSVTPAHEQTEVGLLPRIEVEFSREVTQLLESDAVLTLLNGGPEISMQIAQGETAAHWIMVPVDPLTAGVEYLLTIGTNVAALNGGVLDTPSLTRFTTGAYVPAESPVVSVAAVPDLMGPIHLSDGEQLTFSATASSSVGLDRVTAHIVYEEAQWSLAALESPGSEEVIFGWNPVLSSQALDGAAQLIVEAVDLGGTTTRTLVDLNLDFVGPDAPLSEEALPEVWKFKTLATVFQTEPGGSLIFEVGEAEALELPAGESGQVARSFTLPTSGESLTIQVSAVDSVGNPSESALQHTFTRVPYSCLHSDAGFPTPDVEIDTSVFADDEEGRVTVRYRLDPSIADDTVIHGQLTTQNFSSTPYLSLYFFPRVLGLMKFDDSLLHPCAELVSAKLGFYNRPICADCEMSDSIGFYGLKSAWLPQEVTWLNASADTAWDEAGLSSVDRDDLPLATLVYESVDGVDTGSVDLTTLVQAWVTYLRDNQAGRVNHGFAFFQDDDSRADFHSVDASNPEQVPFLELVWMEQP